jgi:pilus assembly protein CpaF
LQLLNTGHSGSISTIHASSAKQGLSRFTSCVLQSGVLVEDVEYRKEVAAEVGLGFEISVQKLVVVPNVPNFAVFAVKQNVA